MSDNCRNQNLLMIRAFPEINVRGGGGGGGRNAPLLKLYWWSLLCVKYA